jgi:hypothetical protein
MRADGAEERHEVDGWNFRVPGELTLFSAGATVAFFDLWDWSRMILADRPDHPWVNPCTGGEAVYVNYCTTCGCPVEGEPLIPDRGMRLCWDCAAAPLDVPAARLLFVDDYAAGHLESASVERARLEAEALGARPRKAA